MKAVSNLVVPYHPVSSSTCNMASYHRFNRMDNITSRPSSFFGENKMNVVKLVPLRASRLLSLSACYAPVEFRCKGERGADLNGISQPKHAEDVFCQVNLDSEDRIHGQIGYIYMVNSQVVLTHWTKPWATYICISDLYCSNFS